MRSRVRLSSTWEVRGDIRAVLYIISRCSYSIYGYKIIHASVQNYVVNKIIVRKSRALNYAVSQPHMYWYPYVHTSSRDTVTAQVSYWMSRCLPSNVPRPSPSASPPLTPACGASCMWTSASCGATPRPNWSSPARLGPQSCIETAVRSMWGLSEVRLLETANTMGKLWSLLAC